MTGATHRPGARDWLRRLAWLAAIWAASVAALGVAAWLLRGAMRLAGLSA